MSRSGWVASNGQFNVGMLELLSEEGEARGKAFRFMLRKNAFSRLTGV